MVPLISFCPLRVRVLKPDRYETLTKDNEVATATKTTEAEYKTKDSKETAARLAA